ncbi:MAG: alanine racemase [Actinomycetes bacterium]
MRPTFVEVDLDAVRHNVSEIGRLVAPAMVCAVVKADGYGHGDVPVASAALDAGAGMLAVALAEEGIRLREAGIDAPILLLSEPWHDDAAAVVEWGLTPTIYTPGFIDALAATGRRVSAHLKVDTGMHRVGARPEDAAALAARARAAGIEVAAAWTHFAVADEDPAYTKLQIERFREAADGLDVPTTHMANTAGAILFLEARADMVRIGLGTYGLHPCDATRGVVDLRPAMRLVSRVTHLRRLEAGERPSYGRVRPLPKASTVATVPVGYADGFARTWTGDVLIGGRRFPLAGRVTMDQILVDVGDADVAVGDEVVVIGRQGDEEITADEWARALGTVSYEIICTIGPRVPRRYAG